ncbi:tubulinyl-Tyr carboxypeptidase 2-like isoform X2 [Saccostrea cucullata]|uniref:tubulinyl-Tyr carboxypeptidase 2-like isoform X2 n=1 Tax=Saccostrea cuccullata TaxID=36930 RepID=UPI002ED54274
MASGKPKAKEITSVFGTLVREAEPEESGGPACVRVKTVKKSGKEEDVHEENGVLFWVNKSGFPIDNKTWDRMWEHVARIHPDGHDVTHKVRDKKDLPPVPIPQAPTNFSPSVPISERLDKIQNYMRTLQYNHTGTQFFEIRKNRPVSGLLESAKEMIKESLPIKCLEAVILGIYLTNGFLGVERFPLSFKSVFGGNVHRHVVLGIYYAGSYGTIGMSRREDLMYKPLVFKSLSDLVFDYEKSYNKFMHDVKKVKVGMPIPHDPHSYEFISWKAVTVSPNKMSKKEMSKDLEMMAKEIRTRAKSWTITLQSPRKSSTEVPRDLRSSLQQATKIYRAYTSIPSDTGTKKRSQTSATLDSSDYQLRI